MAIKTFDERLESMKAAREQDGMFVDRKSVV